MAREEEGAGREELIDGFLGARVWGSSLIVLMGRSCYTGNAFYLAGFSVADLASFLEGSAWFLSLVTVHRSRISLP